MTLEDVFQPLGRSVSEGRPVEIAGVCGAVAREGAVSAGGFIVAGATGVVVRGTTKVPEVKDALKTTRNRTQVFSQKSFPVKTRVLNQQSLPG